MKRQAVNWKATSEKPQHGQIVWLYRHGIITVWTYIDVYHADFLTYEAWCERDEITLPTVPLHESNSSRAA